ncbi:MAG: LysE family translocator [Alphaproteobacteria bacterium]
MRPRFRLRLTGPFPETAARYGRVCAGMPLGFLLKGLLVGIIIAVPVGPVGVLCVRRTIFHGRLAGFVSGLGAASADAVFGIIAGFGVTFVADLLLGYQGWLRLGGAGFLLYIGIAAVIADPFKATQSQRDPEGLLADYASAFALTISNPITILAFVAIFAAIGFNGRAATSGRAAIMVLGVWLGSLLWWAGLAFASGMVRLTFDRNHLVWINRGSGGILVFCGALLLGSVLLQLFR